MFKKTNYNRPNLFAELKNEFGGHFMDFNINFKAFCEKHPKQIFIGMVVIMLASMVLSFTVIVPMEKRHLAAEVMASQKEASEKNLKTVRNIPGNNIGDVISGIGNLKKTLLIKQQVDAILSKKHLTADDSTRLNTLLDELNLNTTDLNKRYRP